MVIDPEKLKQARISKGLNITDVVEKAKISRVSIYRLENNICKNPQAKTLSALANLYGESIKYFLKEGE